MKRDYALMRYGRYTGRDLDEKEVECCKYFAGMYLTDHALYEGRCKFPMFSLRRIDVYQSYDRTRYPNCIDLYTRDGYVEEIDVHP